MNASKYRPEIDGLRSVAIIPVLLFHAGFSFLPGGFLGVDVFFVISGYLITGILMQDMDAGIYSIAEFYKRRFKRILPAFFFVVVCVLPVAYFVLLPDELAKFGRSISASSLFFSNIFFWKSVNYFSPDAEDQPLLHTWSLSVEEQFYIFFPLILFLLMKKMRRHLMLVISGIGVSSMVLAEIASREFPTANYYLLPFRAWELMAGSMCACYIRSGIDEARVRNRTGDALAICGLLMILASMVVLTPSIRVPSLVVALPVGGACLVVLFASPSNVAGRFLALKPLVFVGLVSYSLYLWHQPVLAFARLTFGKGATMWMSASLLLSFMLAWATWRFVERPFRSPAGPRFGIAETNAAFAVSMVVFAGIGWAVSQAGPINKPSLLAEREGMPSRCLEKIPSTSPTDCRLGSNSGRLRVVLWGDSIADTYSTSLSAALAGVGAIGQASVKHSCPALMGVYRNEPQRLGKAFRETCADYVSRVVGDLANAKPDVVILANSYLGYIDKQNTAGEAIVVGDVSGEAPSVTMIRGLLKTVKALEDLGIRVIVIGPTPVFERFTEVMRASMHGAVPASALRINPYDALQLENSMRTALQQHGSKAHMVSVIKKFCVQDGSCKVTAGTMENMLLMSDESHPSSVLSSNVLEEVLGDADNIELRKL